LKTGQLSLKIKELSQASQYRFKLKCDKYKIVKGMLYTQNNILVVSENKKNEYLEEVWTQFPTGPRKLYNSIKGSGITCKQTEEFLNKQEVDQLHKPIPKKTNISSIHTDQPNKMYEVDLIDMSNYYSSYNNGYS
jgi:hypothetical protein